jgi:hypothetical protein
VPNEAVQKKTLRTFYESIWAEMSGNVIVGLRDRPGPRGKVNRFEDFKYPEQLDEIIQWTMDHRNEDVYASPLIYGDERGESGKLRRIPENALWSQTAYQDSDTCEPQNFRFRPSVHIQSSAGRYQDYWMLTEPVPAHEASQISRKIAIAHRDQGSDPSSWSANKVLRVPLTTNHSHGYPEDVTVTFSGDMYDAKDLSGGYDDIELVDRAIIRLPPDVSYESIEDLPDYADALDKLPEGFDVETLTKEVPADVDRSRMRYRLLCDLFRTGTLDFEDVLSLAWHAPASQKWRDDPRNLRGLIQEALKAQGEVAYETGEGISGPEVPKVGQFDLSLLSDDERASVAGEDNWLKRWDEWNRSKLGRVYNAPYVEMNGLSILSEAFSDCVYLPMSNGEENTNLYLMGVGDSGSGKTSHLKLWRAMMDELHEDSSWSIGTNASPNALHEALLGRDRKTSVLNADEAHGWFAQLNAGSQNWTAGILEMLAQYYDGYVPPMLRTGNRDISGKSARTYFNIHLLGTRKGKLSITNVLTDDMIYSGFLARFIWYIGEDREVSEDSMDVNMANGADYVQLGYEPMCRQWSAEFANTKKLLKVKYKKTRFGIPWDRDAIARVGQMKWVIDRAFRKKHPKWELLDPSIRRLGPNMMRVAALLAAEEAADSVTLHHVLVAIQMCEAWLHNLVAMTEGISASDWKRSCDQILEFVASKGVKVRREVVLRKFSDRKGRELGEQINDLMMQGLLQETQDKGVKWLVLKE